MAEKIVNSGHDSKRSVSGMNNHFFCLFLKIIIIISNTEVSNRQEEVKD